MPTPHKHAALIKQWADDTSQTVWRWREYFPAAWIRCEPTPVWYEDKHYAIGEKPTQPPRKTCVLAGVEFPAPETAPLDYPTAYWMAQAYGVAQSTWHGDSIDKLRLCSGLVHLTREAAEAHGLALLAATKQAIEGAR